MSDKVNGQVYLALYKGKAKNWRSRLVDSVIKLFTKGEYSHCEIAVFHSELVGNYDINEWFRCYTSSPRDGGVRIKCINVNDSNKWDLIKLDNVTEDEIEEFFEKTKSKKYDLLGAIGVVFHNKHSRNRYFCSEWCWEALGRSQGWRFSPNDLAMIFSNKK
ncbi:enoyl-CoA hydratase [Conservatibacter flavescens]|uniref:Enoyl-CoA hydratase n=1 Tax=Conservatibacter flavescens TaxID=28161 RepID=A0A2M8S512_9PAST|nr:enoyl-CoA hydratase [Conservatibacter flavescens]PJG86227.1 enoyl-CoA hydratase [Conservatibacter flavescens]